MSSILLRCCMPFPRPCGDLILDALGPIMLVLNVLFFLWLYEVVLAFLDHCGYRFHCWISPRLFLSSGKQCYGVPWFVNIRLYMLIERYIAAPLHGDYVACGWFPYVALGKWKP